MKDYIQLCIAIIFLIAAAFVMMAYPAAPVPMERLLRNGLTDEQVTKILSTDSNAIVHMNASTWRNVEFNTHRYNNVTNWLAIIGETNDFARLVVPTMNANEAISYTNTLLIAENGRLERRVEYYADAYTNAVNRVAELEITITEEIEFLSGLSQNLQQTLVRKPAYRTVLAPVIEALNRRIEELGGTPPTASSGEQADTQPMADIM